MTIRVRGEDYRMAMLRAVTVGDDGNGRDDEGTHEDDHRPPPPLGTADKL